MKINILEAKTNLSKLVAAAEMGEEVLLARNGTPVARIVKYDAPKVAAPGAWKNQVPYSENWDTPETNAEIARLFDDELAV